MSDMSKFEYNGVVVQRWDDMLSLTDMWRAASNGPNGPEAVENKRPAQWLRSADAKRFIDALTEVLIVGNSHNELIQVVREGGDAETRAHWQIGLAYAKYLSPEFHMWCNTVVRERMEGKIGTPEELEITPEGMRRLSSMQRAVIQSVLMEIVTPVLADMKAQLRKDLAEIAGTDPSIVRQKGYRSMRELAIAHNCRPGSKGAMSFGRMVSGASNMARAWCAEQRPDPAYPHGLCFKEQRTEGRPGIFMFHEIGIGSWLKEYGIPRFREHNNATEGQKVLQLVLPSKKED
jgi:hypothetical protein